jgi:hypothetical protein
LGNYEIVDPLGGRNVEGRDTPVNHVVAIKRLKDTKDCLQEE